MPCPCGKAASFKTFDPKTLLSSVGPISVARRFEDVGVSALIVTDIDRDGTVMGFNVEAFGAIADAVAIPVIAAGGLASVDDIVRLKAHAGTPISGAVLGRALVLQHPDALAD